MAEGSFTGWERSIARLLRSTPAIKRTVKRVYKRFTYLRYGRGQRSSSVLPFRRVATGDASSFFGYYDRSPENGSGLVLVHRVRTSSSSSCLTVSVSDATGTEVASVPGNVYNWQQGARALWLDDQSFIFNRWSKGSQRVMAVIAGGGGGEREYALPVQDAFKSDFYLAIDIERVSTLQPEYGYSAVSPVPRDALREGDDSGIWRVDTDTGATRLLYSLNQARRLVGRWDHHCLDLFNHITISPSGLHFLVLHRWYDGGVRRERLLVGQSDGSRLSCLVDTGMISHCAWADDATIIGYMRGPEGVERYWLVDVGTGQMRAVAGGALDRFGDGHPSVHGDWFVTDTYPDRGSRQTLLLANWKTGAWTTLGHFFHPLDLEGEMRCDLHPRWSPAGERVYFDSAFSGQRELYVMELEKSCFPSL
jgi:hypothetical protein